MSWLYVFLVLGAALAIGRIWVSLRKLREMPNEDWDSRLIERLRRGGTDPFRPLDIDFFLALPSEPAAAVVAERLKAEGFAVDVRAVTESTDHPFSVHAIKAMQLNADGIRAVSSRMREMAAAQGGRYDGWTAPARAAVPDATAVDTPAADGARRPRRKLDREETERRLVTAFDRVWSRDGIQGLGVNAVLKEAGVGKALLYRYFGDFVGLARAWAQGETFLPKPPSLAGVNEPDRRRPQVAAAIAYARALRARPKTRELLIVELLRTSPVTDALDDMRARFGREMREFVTAAGAPAGEDAFALSFLVTAAMTYLALRADAVPDYYSLRLDREADWVRIEQMLERVAARVLEPDSKAVPPGARAEP